MLTSFDYNPWLLLFMDFILSASCSSVVTDAKEQHRVITDIKYICKQLEKTKCSDVACKISKGGKWLKRLEHKISKYYIRKLEINLRLKQIS